MRRRRRQFKFKKKRPKLKKTLFFIYISAFAAIMLIFYINSRINQGLMAFAKSETKKLTTLIINRAVSKQIASDLDLDEIVILEKDNQGKLVGVKFNSSIVNKVLTKTTNSVQANLKMIEEGKVDLLEYPDTISIHYDRENFKKGIIYEIPLGIVTKNSLLSNVGPKIPVRLRIIGDVTSNVSSRITDYGINNAMIEIFVQVKVTTRVILPFVSDTMSVSTEIPVAIQIINGEVPHYFISSRNQSKSLVVPVE